MVTQQKRLYFLLIGLGAAFIIFLLAVIIVGSKKEEKEVAKNLPPSLKEAAERTKSAFTCGEKISYQDAEYRTIDIDGKCWFAENLKATKYRDGTAITNAKAPNEWAGNKSGAYSCYDNLPENCRTYGMIYNWYAAKNTAGICPEGWRVPTHPEWAKMETAICQSLGYGNCDIPFGDAAQFGWKGRDEGKHLKAKTAKGLDTFGFGVLMAGFRSPGGLFDTMGQSGFFWTSSDFAEEFAYGRMFDLEKDTIRRFSDSKKSGFSIRCVKE